MISFTRKLVTGNWKVTRTPLSSTQCTVYSFPANCMQWWNCVRKQLFSFFSKLARVSHLTSEWQCGFPGCKSCNEAHHHLALTFVIPIRKEEKVHFKNVYFSAWQSSPWQDAAHRDIRLRWRVKPILVVKDSHQNQSKPMDGQTNHGGRIRESNQSWW